MKTTLVLAALAVFALAGCEEKKMEPVPVGEMKEYRDPGIGWSIQFPADWPVTNAEVGRARFYNATEVDAKFRVPNEPGVIGAEISVDVIKTADAAAQMAKGISDMKTAGFQIQPEEKVTVGDKQATKVKFGANYGKNSIIYGHHVYIPVGDSTLYDLSFSGFGQFYEAYAAVFDASLNSFKPAKPKVPGRDETLPAENFTTVGGKLFSFDVPENFNSTNPSKGKYDEVAEYRGVRLDCSVRLDVQPAKGLTLEKVFEQNTDLLRGGAKGKATVGGQPAMTLTGAVSRDVTRRFYFVVKDDKIFRITTDWFRPQTAEYQEAYDKVIASVKWK